ncbi:MAG TPA: hypothetical protein VMI75_07615 [Polyangiaceae bacterium]|nr:hypothetical protein [Polyangiaceae bacterium]
MKLSVSRALVALPFTLVLAACGAPPDGESTGSSENAVTVPPPGGDPCDGATRPIKGCYVPKPTGHATAVNPSGIDDVVQTFDLSGFTPNEQVRLAIDGSASVAMPVDSTGGGPENVAIQTTTIGAHTVSFTGLTSGLTGSATYTVLGHGPAFAQGPASFDAQFGASYTVYVSAFGASESVAIDLVSASGSSRQHVNALTTDATGKGQLVVSAPTAPAGAYHFEATGATSGIVRDAASISITASAKIWAQNVTWNTSDSVAFWGAQPNTNVVASIDGAAVGSAMPAADGYGYIGFVAKGVGAQPVQLTGGITATVDMIISPVASLGVTTGSVGSSNAVYLHGMSSNYSVWFDDTLLVGPVTPTSSGVVTTYFTVPSAPLGVHQIDVYSYDAGDFIFELPFTVTP